MKSIKEITREICLLQAQCFSPFEYESVNDVGCELYEFVNMVEKLREPLDRVREDLRFLLKLEYDQTGMFDKEAMMKQMLHLLDGVLD